MLRPRRRRETLVLGLKHRHNTEEAWASGGVRLRRHCRRHATLPVQCETSSSRVPSTSKRGHPNLSCSSTGRDGGTRTSGVSHIRREGRSEKHSGRCLIGADGGAAAPLAWVEFHYWPDRLLLVSTPFDFYSVIPGSARWLRRDPGAGKRPANSGCGARFLVNEDATDERVRRGNSRDVVAGCPACLRDRAYRSQVHQRWPKIQARPHVPR
jgi:hypothetical protein